MLLDKPSTHGWGCAQIAVKELPTTRLLNVETVLDEVRMHRFWQHPNIVAFFGSHQDSQSLFIIMEKVQPCLAHRPGSWGGVHAVGDMGGGAVNQVDGGSLDALIFEHKFPFPQQEPYMANYTAQMLKVWG